MYCTLRIVTRQWEILVVKKYSQVRVDSIYSIGLKRKLADILYRHGIKTVPELRRWSLYMLRKRFGMQEKTALVIIQAVQNSNC